jgi:serine phosphatase RsbU (regulator of sigma subunit)
MQDYPLDRLSVQIDALQEGFRKLSKAATLSDLAGRFTAVVRESYPGSVVTLSHRPAPDGPWQLVGGEGTLPPTDLLVLPAGQKATAVTHHDSPAQLSIVHRLVDRSHIGLMVGGGTVRVQRGSTDVVALRLFVHLFENAYQEILHRRSEKELVFSLNQRVLQLNSLIDTGIEVAKLDQKTLPHALALQRAAALTNAGKGLVRVVKGNVTEEEICFPGGMPLAPPTDGTARIRSSFKFAGKTYTFELWEKESRSGIAPFEETDQLLLDALARQVHASLENRFLLKQSLEKQRIDQDIAVAASIQQRILPASLPSIEGYEIAGVNIPSITVGGDYYDCIHLPDGRYLLIVADVAGKGVPAALLVSTLHAYLTAYLETTFSLLHLAHRLNRVISSASTDEKFITAYLALLTPETGEVESLNAGHNPAYYLRNDGTVHELGEGGVAFAMLDMDYPYAVEHVTIQQGERLLLYTDGVTEARNTEEELYDNKSPLKDFLTGHREATACQFIDALIKDIKKFTGAAPQSDDITALYVVRH